MVDADPLEGAFAVNCLAVRPGKIIISAHAERTIRRLRQAGVEVVPMDYSEMPKSGGGIHCSTLPLIRDAVE
jgi:N-dimethylarginine dimethylaminohydrolase